ncbi:mannitol dehydrogenase family protein [Odoribacter laneus]|uniref:mannitol dehydrogenase family protein n=1 Tax=Odoribacter laneus TaxID=626933 RepID=UPI000338F576|nr:mannitol dehydrogenase family protein [Odoribacter laneus]CCZ80734.1 putative uncharacterized protein [Odoribacter laneus CAG:561]
MKTLIQHQHANVIPFPYDRSCITTGIVHIGVGNFHRAHEEYYTNQLLSDPSQQKWGICGIALLAGDKSLYSALKQQDNLYTLTVCGRDNRDIAYEIGSLKELIWGMENPDAVIHKIAHPEIKIITLTITEGGYNIDKASGNFILETPAVQHDLKNPDTPQTVFGFVAAGLRKRMKAHQGPVTILSCDNLQHNGNTARKAFCSFIAAQDSELADWVNTNVTFPNSMVDRITPAVTPADIERLNRHNGVEDAAPVYCEDFIQWVIEDNFIAGRPDWEKVGVEFTTDVSAYENMKLSLLNASHSMLAYPAFLAGYRKVDDAVHDKRFARYLQQFMDTDITPYVPAPGHTDLTQYKQTLLERFGNRSVSDQLSRLCSDGASKIPVYIMPNLIQMIRDKADLRRVSFFTAAYRHYLKYQQDDKGNIYEVNDPWLTETDWIQIQEENPLAFLALSPFKSIPLQRDEGFVTNYLQLVSALKEKGVVEMLETILQ